MSDVRILPHAPRGKLAAPPSKSAAHRALICAALSAMPCRVFPVAASGMPIIAQGVFVAVGLVPDNGLFSGQITLDPAGYIATPLAVSRRRRF